ncbi:hypothetical protein PM3016_5475 [Paenibacillus mucilaginosus 3016]|uniref:Uncharacterized protein n=1 Tax=Paenibacillus mucilaginosus 3016 TaxID=1116391 RepID=H6NG48_9BACL|nr:hypothetical protein PM3016_5475 [Paenibacillus mucilaginosus 3016]WFA20671.1 hypothetical protein ERY13_27235 [Paenibacillus mucilaginosus]
MRSPITEHQWRAQMLAWKKSPAVIEGMELIDVLIAESDREMEHAAEIEKTRLGGRASLRSRLRVLVLSVYHRTVVRGKGAAPDA